LICGIAKIEKEHFLSLEMEAPHWLIASIVTDYSPYNDTLHKKSAEIVYYKAAGGWYWFVVKEKYC